MSTLALLLLLTGPLGSVPVVWTYSSRPAFVSRSGIGRRVHHQRTGRIIVTAPFDVCKDKRDVNCRSRNPLPLLQLAAAEDGGRSDYDKQWEASKKSNEKKKNDDVKKKKNDSEAPSVADVNKQWDAFSKNKQSLANEADKDRPSRRDRLMGWVSGSTDTNSAGGTGSKPTPTMVQPIPLQPEDTTDATTDDALDSITNAINEELSADPLRVKAKFDSLFAGMPSISDFLNSPPAPVPDESGTEDSSRSRPGRSRREADDTWFETERQRIVDNYDDMLRDMLLELKEQKRLDPETFPKNAEAMIKETLKQEMDTEITATKERMSQQELQSYEENARADMELADISGPPQESVQKLIDESEAEYAQKQASRLEIDEFLRYEAEAKRRSTRSVDKQVNVPEKGANLDQWALEQLQGMADQRQDVDGEEMIMDLLEDSVDDLRERMAKEAKAGSIKSRTMKEWQMYRSIATRLAGQEAADGDTRVYEDQETMELAREDRILHQLESWKSYIEKEVVTREQSGLARGPKLPFEWQESWIKEAKIKEPAQPDKRSRSEVRRDLNRMSLEAMESLLANSDPARREKLQKEIDYLKANIDDDVVDEDVAKDMAGPVDMSGLFSSSSSSEDKAASVSAPVLSGEIYSSDNSSSPPQQPPVTPFFSDPGLAENIDTPLPDTPFFSYAEPPSPPVTPFFTQAEDNEAPLFTQAENAESKDTVLDYSKLGSMKEQKLRAMYQRAGARSAGAQEKIRSEWEAFQGMERQTREQAGLTGGEASTLSSSRNFNVSEMMLEGGDFDAEKILASIGPRPSRKKKPASSGSVMSRKRDEEASEEKLYAGSSIDSEEVVSSLYRAVSAVGGGRGKDDPEAKASFAEYVRKEDELRESLDSLDAEISSKSTPVDASFDDVEYAEDALASLGPRPILKRTRILDEGEYSDRGGILSSIDDNPDTDDDAEEEGKDGLDVAVDMPEWLRQENSNAGSPQRGKTFLGSDIDEVFEDDDYEKKARQLAEYERRRSGKDRQMGIDITDVLSRRGQETDDYADYKFDEGYLRGRQNSGWGVASFEARKTNLLEYTEIDAMEVNALMDHKDSVYSTGVSQYLPRINKPFKEFGAIFRLESVLVDVTGLQMVAWSKIAEKRGYKAPKLEDVRQASVARPEVAVKEVFFWTDDFIECGQIAMEHRAALREAFDSWMTATGISVPEPTSKLGGQAGQGNLGLGAELLGDIIPPERLPASVEAPKTEADMLNLFSKAWTQTAKTCGLTFPTREEILFAGTLGPDLAIREAFRWTADPVEVDKIASSYRTILRSMWGEKKESNEVAAILSSETVVVRPKKLNEGEYMEIQFLAWTSVAESFGFEPPVPDEVLAAVAIGDVEVAVRDGFGWTEDSQLISEVVGSFRTHVAEMTAEKTGGPAKVEHDLIPQQKRLVIAEPVAVNSGPTPEELLQIHRNAWTVAVQPSVFECPSLDQIQLAMNLDPSEAIRRLFRWTEDNQQVTELSSRFISALKSESAQYIQKYQLRPETALLQPAKLSKQGPSADEIFQIALEAWESTASRGGFPPPDIDQVQFALSVGPEDAIVTGFGWAIDKADVLELVNNYREEISVRRERLWQGTDGPGDAFSGADDDENPMVKVLPNTAKWLKSLLDVEMQCGVVSYLDSDQVDVLLEQAGLADMITPDKRVSANSGYNRDSYQLLGAALRLERRPDHCVVFDASPYSSVAAHFNEMQSVCIIGPYPRYELLSADTTTNSFEDLTSMNIRRLFGERVYDQPLMETQQAQPETRKKQKTTYWDEE